MYSVWSFSSWQLQNCSVGSNEMCTGTVKGLGKCDKTAGWYMAVQLSVHIYIDTMVTAVYITANIWRLFV